jgi:Ca-activated chloride channel family protein
MTMPPSYSSQSSAGKENIGLAAGGAKDINNFRENIEADYLPLPTDVTYEGLFYDYYFDTGRTQQCDKLFCPSYAYAVTEDPFSGKTEYYLSVGLNSGLKESDFQRKKLNLVVVLDVSGSMESPFDRYYYDRLGNPMELEGDEAHKTKIEVATESVAAILDHLNDDDYFGLVVFNDRAHRERPLKSVARTDMDDLRDDILDLSAGGSTNLDDGMRLGSDLFDDLDDLDPSEYESRIIFLTDAQPNQGDTSQGGMLRDLEDNADRRIYTTFIGIGVDFNTELIEYITRIKGANYYSVHSSREFRQRMKEEFEYMVTPLVFDLELSLKSDGWEIEEVYGSPEADEATGELMKINTLFPSKSEEGQTRGGLVLLKLRCIDPAEDLTLKVSYEDRNGEPDISKAVINIRDVRPEYFPNSGIRKGVLLARYADPLKNWMFDEREHFQFSRPWEPRVDDDHGIVMPPPMGLGLWERQSLPLRVSSPYRRLFGNFHDYFEAEMDGLDDNTLEQELDVLDKLSDWR